MPRKPGFQDRKPELSKWLDLGFQRLSMLPGLVGEEGTVEFVAWMWAYHWEGRQVSKLYAEDVP